MIIGGIQPLFRKNLKYLRRKHRLTYTQLGFALGMDREVLRDLEKDGGGGEIDYRDLRMLCAVFGGHRRGNVSSRFAEGLMRAEFPRALLRSGQ